MIVGVAVCELHLPAVRNLKAKRKIVKGLVDRIHGRYRVSVAETAHHDLHQRAEISLAVVGTSPSEMEQMLENLRGVFELEMEAMVTGWFPRLLNDARGEAFA